MAIQPITAHAAEIPLLHYGSLPKNGGDSCALYQLSSHARAKAALDQGLKIRKRGYNIFIIGEEGSHRLKSTLAYIKGTITDQASAHDWVYVNDFSTDNEAIPLRLPAGTAKQFKNAVALAIEAIHTNLMRVLLAPEMLARLKNETEYVEADIQTRLTDLKEFAISKGLDLQRLEDGSISVIDGEETTSTATEEPRTTIPLKHAQNDPDAASVESATEYHKASAREVLYKKVQELTDHAQNSGETLFQRLENIKEKAAEKIINPSLKKLQKTYAEQPETVEWLESLREDLLTHIALFMDMEDQKPFNLLNRYAVNVLVRRTKNKPGGIVLSSNPTYENLFGSLQYRTTQTGMVTDFTMAHAGSLHQANGGILVIRAESLARHPDSWDALKQTLRTQEIKIEDRQKQGVLVEHPVLNPIPLDVQIILVGAPGWYYDFFYNNAEFKSFFKIKADIEPSFSKQTEDLQCYASCLQSQSLKKVGYPCEKEALGYLMGYSARLSGNREKISTQFDRLMDLLIEAAYFTQMTKQKRISISHITEAIQARDHRNDRLKDQLHRHFDEGMTILCTEGTSIGQVNALTVQSVGAESFGAPARITARTYVGRQGVINIEHMVALSGPIQHKGVLGLEGYLRGAFSQEFPLSFSCSLTFEQNYGGVEGDSASLAELCAILSSLAEAPIRQDIAITGSINQFGEVQAVGGINEKIEGFFYICQNRGLTGTQGVVIPEVNRASVAVIPEISDALSKGRFHLWSVKTIGDAVKILMDQEAGDKTFLKGTGPKTIFQKAYQKLKLFDVSLHERGLTTLRKSR